MYLSKVMLHARHFDEPYQWHKSLWKLFPDRPDASRDFLFRVEQRLPGQGGVILLQSQQPPRTAKEAEVLAVKRWQPNLQTAMSLRFKLCANVVKSIKDAEKRLNRKGEIKRCRVPLYREEERLAWLQRKWQGAAELQQVTITDAAPVWFNKGKEAQGSQQSKEEALSGKIQPVIFEGMLEIRQLEAFYQLLQKGTGPAKAFGCGLISLARL